MAAEVLLLAVLAKNRVYKLLPAFCVYICWNLLTDLTLFALAPWFAPPGSSQYFRLYEIQMVVDAAVVFSVLVELAWSVLRPIRRALPRHAWVLIAAAIAIAGLLLWPVAGLTEPADLNSAGRYFFRLQQTFALLRVVIFLGLAGFSQLLAIGWRNRELQVATGLGFYSIISLAITVLHTQQVVGPQYHFLDVAGVLSYLGTLTFWVLAFTTKEAERQNFSPQMANFLLLVGGTAKTDRVALNDFLVTSARRKDDR
ncbi:MAG: hypothetical protein WCE75_11390 [Terracidiphilus sp.]